MNTEPLVGVHRTGTLTHSYVHPLGLQCFADHPDTTAAPVRAGSAVVSSSLTPHRTGPNTTDAVRKTYILQFAPDGVEVLRGDPSRRSPTTREHQNDPDRQYPVLHDGPRIGGAA
jgi:phytanoyl-CoA hydroxylase